MFRTKALRRLGVPVLAAVTLVGGTPALLGPAQAAMPRAQVVAPDLTLDLDPLPDTEADINAATGDNAVNDIADEDRRFRAVVDTTESATATTGTVVTFTVSGGNGQETATIPATGVGAPTDAADTADATVQCTTETLQATDDANDSACDVVIDDFDRVVGDVLTVRAFVSDATSIDDSGTLRFRVNPAEARTVAVTPDGATTPAGGTQTFTATVRDAQDRPVEGVAVSFSESGAGRISSATSTVATGISGTAAVTTTSATTEGGLQTVTGSIAPATTLCEETGGDCSDTGTTTFQVATTPPPATNTATVTITIDTPVITAGSRGSVTLTGRPNQDVVLEAYTRPSIAYRVVRTGTLSAEGTLTFNNLLPFGNTRLRAREVGGSFDESAVILVRSKLSLRTERLGTRTYRFTGRVLPARAGQLVYIYRGNVLTTVARVQRNGIYAVDRRFLGTGTFTFTARTTTDITNVGGVSPRLRLTIR